MGNLFWQQAIPAAAAGLALSFLIESRAKPATLPVWRRHFAVFCVHCGLWLILFAAELAVFRRVWLASANVSALMYVLVLINNAKFQSLREPLIYQDVEYCVDVFKHPRLYLPFLGAGRVVLGAGAIGLVLYVGTILESPLSVQMASHTFALSVAAIFVFAFLLLAVSSKYVPSATFQPQVDVRQLGLLTSLWGYAQAERINVSVPSPFDFKGLQPPDRAALPNLVVVQSESFFDARGLYAGIRPEVLQQYDQTKRSAVCHGRLAVPAWGANTVRTEFAFLSAVSAAALGVHQFNPYRKFARAGYPTLASLLKSLGYRTVCVHPYDGSFYDRDKLYPLLGFDEFIDIRAFNSAQNAGPFIGDMALGKAVCNLLQAAATQPLFVFVITMENHGPLHLERTQPGDVERFYSAAPPDGCEALTVYLRHLSNADQMLGMLCERLKALSRPGWLCWYGDHVPIMPAAYKAVDPPDGNTDYLLWRTDGKLDSAMSLNLSIEHLSPLLVREMGLDDRRHAGKRHGAAGISS